MFFKNKINDDDILWWWRELALLLRHDIPLVDALLLLANHNGKKILDTLFLSISEQVAKGETLSIALAQHPQYFNQTSRTIIAMGENIDQLSRATEAVSRLSQAYHHQSIRFNKKLSYPMVLLSVFFCMAILFSHVILPQFLLIYGDLGKDLPGLTLVIMSIISWSIDYLWLNIAIVASLVGLWLYHVPFHDYVIVRIPSFSSLVKTRSLLELFVLLAFLPNNKKTISKQVFKSMVGGISNTHHRQTLMHAYSSEDSSLTSIVRKTPWIPKNIAKMIEVGNEVNALARVLESLAKDYLINHPPNNSLVIIMKVFISIMVGVFVVAMYLPIFSMAGIF